MPRASARPGGLDLSLLLGGGEPAAFAYNYHYAGGVYGLRMGHSAAVKPRWGRHRAQAHAR